MRTIRLAAGVTLGFFLLAFCARLAGAQTYVWTDERGVVHAAADPSEIPPAQRAKAMRDALGRHDNVNITTPDTESSEAPPAAAAPAKPTEAPSRSFEGDAPSETHNGVGLEAGPKVTPQRRKSDPEPKEQKIDPDHLPPPEPGFEWNCATDPEGGPPKCEQFEKKSSRRERRAQAREKAQKDLGVDDPSDEFDPDVAKKVQERAEREFQDTTPQPKLKAKHSSGDDETDSSDDD